MKQIRATVVSNSEVMPDTRLMWLYAPETAATARPGQFVMVYCGEDTVLRRPLSIHRVDGNNAALLFSVVGKGTRWLSRCTAGDTVDIFGPLGNGFSVPPDANNLLLVAGGIGIAPMRFLIDTALRAGKKLTVIPGARTAEHLLPISVPQRLFDEGVLPSSINVVNATENGSEGFRGMATDLIPAYIDHHDHVYACGPEEMYRTMGRMPELKNKPVQVSLEIMMGCGAGICYGCTIETRKGLRQVCRDGPVFELVDIIRED